MSLFGSAPWWVLVFFAIGVFSTIVNILQLFLAMGRIVRHMEAKGEVPTTGDPGFLDALGRALHTPVRRGGTVELLNNGDEFIPALLEEIRRAERSINCMTYIWKKGRMADLIFEALVERARDGVEVRVLIDGLGGFFSPKHHVKALREAGGAVEYYSPFSFESFPSLNTRNHRRAFVFDGKVGFTGGFAVADYWLGHAQDPHHWRDTMARVTGPMAESLQSTFLQSWVNTRGEMLLGPKYYPAPPGRREEEGIAHVAVIHAPAEKAQPMRDFFWLTLNSAEKSIYLANAYFLPDKPIRTILAEKAQAGVDVRLLLPSSHTDNELVRWGGHRYFESLLACGVRIYEYQPTMMHAKHLVVDGRWSVIGSSNLDDRSIKLNQENVLGILDEDFGNRLREVYLEDLRHAREFTLEAWRRRPWYCFVRERLSNLLQEQF